MFLNAFTISLILTITIVYFIIYAEFLKNKENDDKFWHKFFTLLGLSFLGVIILTWFLCALFSCGTDIVIELLKTRI